LYRGNMISQRERHRSHSKYDMKLRMKFSVGAIQIRCHDGNQHKLGGFDSLGPVYGRRLTTRRGSICMRGWLHRPGSGHAIRQPCLISLLTSVRFGGRGEWNRAKARSPVRADPCVSPMLLKSIGRARNEPIAFRNDLNCRISEAYGVPQREACVFLWVKKLHANS
jgi:hypothetical protein